MLKLDCRMARSVLTGFVLILTVYLASASAQTVLDPEVAVDVDGAPVVAYVAADSNGIDQIFVRKWVGAMPGWPLLLAPVACRQCWPGWRAMPS